MGTAVRRRRPRIAFGSLVAQLARVVVVGKRPDISTRLYADASTAQHKEALGELGDTHGPEFESGRDPYGPMRNVRHAELVIVLIILYSVLFTFVVSYAAPLILFCSILFGVVAFSLLVRFGP